ncbi:hypothetical protein ACF0H5_005192 [Mactra antiquata]
MTTQREIERSRGRGGEMVREQGGEMVREQGGEMVREQGGEMVREQGGEMVREQGEEMVKEREVERWARSFVVCIEIGEDTDEIHLEKPNIIKIVGSDSDTIIDTQYNTKNSDSDAKYSNSDAKNSNSKSIYSNGDHKLDNTLNVDKSDNKPSVDVTLDNTINSIIYIDDHNIGKEEHDHKYQDINSVDHAEEHEIKIVTFDQKPESLTLETDNLRTSETLGNENLQNLVPDLLPPSYSSSNEIEKVDKVDTTSDVPSTGTGVKCDEFSCLNNGNCVDDGSVYRNKLRCNCELGTFGEKCEHIVDVRYPRFYGNSYLALPVLKNGYKEIDLQLEFKPTAQYGLLLFSSEFEDARSDFISVAIIDGLIEFRYCFILDDYYYYEDDYYYDDYYYYEDDYYYDDYYYYEDDYYYYDYYYYEDDIYYYEDDYYYDDYYYYEDDYYEDDYYYYEDDYYYDDYYYYEDDYYYYEDDYYYDDYYYYEDDYYEDDYYYYEDDYYYDDYYYYEDDYYYYDYYYYEDDYYYYEDDYYYYDDYYYEDDYYYYEDDYYYDDYYYYEDDYYYYEDDYYYYEDDYYYDDYYYYEDDYYYYEDDYYYYEDDYYYDDYYYYEDDYYYYEDDYYYEDYYYYYDEEEDEDDDDGVYDCGTGMAILRSESTVVMETWNILRIYRYENIASIWLNQDQPVNGTSPGSYSRLTLRLNLYIGGYDKIESIGDKVGTSKGFVGCVQEVKVNGYRYDLRKSDIVGDAQFGSNIGECSEGLCDNVLCQNGGQCKVISADSHICLCPLGTVGESCQHVDDVHIPEFNQHSYLEYKGLGRTALLFLEIELVVKATKPDGLILYNGYTLDRSGDFISLALHDSYIEYRFDLGTGPAIIRSPERITLNKWHWIKISRTGMEGILEIDDRTVAIGQSQGAFTQLTVTQNLYIGGHRNFDETSKQANVTYAFEGCIQKLTMNNKVIRLIQDAISGINVDSCEHACIGEPCLHQGQCVPKKDIYTCYCPLGYSGKNCQKDVDRNMLNPRFTSESFLMYSQKNIAKRIGGDTLDVQLSIKPQSTNGLLLWSGPNVIQATSDYISIGIKDGIIQFRYNLGSGDAIIISNVTNLYDGLWHNIHVKRDKQIGYLTVDGNTVTGQSKGSYTMLNTNKILYIGGMTDVFHDTLHKYTTGYSGCMKDVIFDEDFMLNLLESADNGRNIIPCS